MQPYTMWDYALQVLFNAAFNIWGSQELCKWNLNLFWQF